MFRCSWFGRFGKEKSQLSLPEIEQLFFGRPYRNLVTVTAEYPSSYSN